MRVSVIIPLLNEEQYISELLRCLKNQDYNPEEVEFLFLDGGSSDSTNSIIISSSELKHYYIIPNPNRTQAWAMKTGVEHAKGDIIIRLDAHADFPSDYISECVKGLEAGLGDNVGGYAVTKGKGRLGRTIAKLLSSKFGVGNSQFRTSVSSGLVDTVPFGCFYKEYLEKIGGFDTRFDRNEDNEINYRIRKLGGNVYLSDTIHFTYYCRNTLRGLCQYAKSNGLWNVITMKLVPGSMGIRHFVPLAFLLSVISLSILSFVHWLFMLLLGIELTLYFALAIYFALKDASDAIEFFKLVFLFPLFHICYGYGSLKGLFIQRKYSSSSISKKAN